MSTKRRGFLKALGLSVAGGAAAVVAPPGVTEKVKVVERTVFQDIWPADLPPLVWEWDPAETDGQEERRLLKMLLAAPRVELTLPNAQDITWNGMQFRLAKGVNPNVPKPIADVWEQAEQDLKQGNRDLWGEVQKEWSPYVQAEMRQLGKFRDGARIKGWWGEDA